MPQKRLLSFANNSPDVKIAYLENLARIAGIAILMLLIYKKFCEILKQKRKIMGACNAKNKEN